MRNILFVIPTKIEKETKMGKKKSNGGSGTQPEATTATAKVHDATGIFGNSPNIQDVSGQVLNTYGRRLSGELATVLQHSVPVITSEKMQYGGTTKLGMVIGVDTRDKNAVESHLQNYDGQLKGVMYRLKAR